VRIEVLSKISVVSCRARSSGSHDASRGGFPDGRAPYDGTIPQTRAPGQSSSGLLLHGAALDSVKAAKLLFDRNGRYGATSGSAARASELNQSREAARIGRALAATPLAAKTVVACFVADYWPAPEAFTPNRGTGTPKTVHEHVAGTVAWRSCHHDRSRSSNADSK
jgi:hypothetical protein